MTETFLVGVRHSAYHLALKRWREGRGLSQAQAADEIGINVNYYGQIERLAMLPGPSTVRKIALATDLTDAEICPGWLRERFPDVAFRLDTAFEVDALSLADPANRLILAAPDTALELAERGDLPASVQAALGALTPRQRRVIECRFNLGEGGRPRTLDEVAKELHMTRERVRQIEGDALRKLRHPKVAAPLRAYIGRLA